MAKHLGKASLKFDNKISVMSTSSTVGTLEGKGPLRDYFDNILSDNLLGLKSWEKAESKISTDTIQTAINKANLKPNQINYVLSGDLLNQCCGSTYGVKSLNIPFFGIFGACSTFGEALSLGSVLIESGAEYVAAAASSHFCSAEKQFRFPLDLGTQRPPTSTWTVTGAGAAVLSNRDEAPYITGITTGKIIDYGITDANNMGSAMAPAAADLVVQHFKDFERKPSYYDMIITGDLGTLGSELMCELVRKQGYDISKQIFDCGISIFDNNELDTHCGGSGCACSATVFSGYIYSRLKKKEINRVLLIPTGALMSTTSIQQGESIGGIAHGIVIENEV